ncbi:MAG: F0F1 ATP synthase subunit delta [Alphaproteobacteria bacterium]|nr:F0F1 ATP synthase subunit delta [Alphaproteobacteria bacterium]
MEIDLFTFAAQIINLIILLFLLRKFLYLPVLKAVEARQKLIADELESAALARKQAQKEEAKCAAKMQEIEAHKQDILAKVQQEAQILAAKLSDEAEAQYKQSQKKLHDKLAAEQKNFDATVQNLVIEHFNKFADSALKQLAGTDLNELVIKQFEKQLSLLSDDDKKMYAQAFEDKKVISVKSADKLSAVRKTDLERMLKSVLRLTDKIKFEYSINKDLIGGICVQADEQMIAWSLQGYLQDFKKNLNNEVLRMLSRG